MIIKPSIIADASQFFVKNGVLHHLYQPLVSNLQKHKPLTSQTARRALGFCPNVCSYTRKVLLAQNVEIC